MLSLLKLEPQKGNWKYILLLLWRADHNIWSCYYFLLKFSFFPKGTNKKFPATLSCAQEISFYNNYRPIHFSEPAKLQNSTLTKTDGWVVKLEKRTLVWSWNIKCGNCSREIILRVDAKNIGKITYFHQRKSLSLLTFAP